MELEKQVTSLEWSRRLKELGVKQESYFVWATFFNTSSTTPSKNFSQLVDDGELAEMEEHTFLHDLNTFSAYTVAGKRRTRNYDLLKQD